MPLPSLLLGTNVPVPREMGAQEENGRQQGEEQRQQQPPGQKTTAPEYSGTNNPPIAQLHVSPVSLEEIKPVQINLMASDPDKDDTLTFVLLSGPTQGTIAGFNKNTGTLTYIPEEGFRGQDSIKYKVVDSNGAESNGASVDIRLSSTARANQTSTDTSRVDNQS